MAVLGQKQDRHATCGHVCVRGVVVHVIVFAWSGGACDVCLCGVVVHVMSVCVVWWCM